LDSGVGGKEVRIQQGKNPHQKIHAKDQPIERNPQSKTLPIDPRGQRVKWGAEGTSPKRKKGKGEKCGEGAVGGKYYPLYLERRFTKN